MTKISKVIFTFSIVFIFAGALGFAWVIGVPEMIEDYLERREPATIDLDLTEEEKAEMEDIIKRADLAAILYFANKDSKEYKKIAEDCYFPIEYEEVKENIEESFMDESSENFNKTEAEKEIRKEQKRVKYEFRRFKELFNRICILESWKSSEDFYEVAVIYFFNKDKNGKWRIEEEIDLMGPQDLVSMEEEGIRKLQEKDAGEK